MFPCLLIERIFDTDKVMYHCGLCVKVFSIVHLCCRTTGKSGSSTDGGSILQQAMLKGIANQLAQASVRFLHAFYVYYACSILMHIYYGTDS